MERLIPRNIIERINRAGVQDKFDASRHRRGKWSKSRTARSAPPKPGFFPGYVLVEMVMDDDTCGITSSPTPTRSPASSVGPNRPRRSPKRVRKIVSRAGRHGQARHKEVDSRWVSTCGSEDPFTDFNGTVEDVNYKEQRFSVSVTIFGRSHAVELSSLGREDLIAAQSFLRSLPDSARTSGSSRMPGSPRRYQAF